MGGGRLSDVTGSCRGGSPHVTGAFGVTHCQWHRPVGTLDVAGSSPIARSVVIHGGNDAFVHSDGLRRSHLGRRSVQCLILPAGAPRRIAGIFPGCHERLGGCLGGASEHLSVHQHSTGGRSGHLRASVGLPAVGCGRRGGRSRECDWCEPGHRGSSRTNGGRSVLATAARRAGSDAFGSESARCRRSREATIRTAATP